MKKILIILGAITLVFLMTCNVTAVHSSQGNILLKTIENSHEDSVETKNFIGGLKGLIFGLLTWFFAIIGLTVWGLLIILEGILTLNLGTVAVGGIVIGIGLCWPLFCMWALSEDYNY